jgi:hypothetical protein
VNNRLSLSSPAALALPPTIPDPAAPNWVRLPFAEAPLFPHTRSRRASARMRTSTSSVSRMPRPVVFCPGHNISLQRIAVARRTASRCIGLNGPGAEIEAVEPFA